MRGEKHTLDRCLSPYLTICGFILSVFLLQGCTAIQPLPDKARAGDTIVLAVGSADGLNRTNTTIAYLPDANPGAPIDLTPNIRAITRVYPDRTSQAWLFDNLLMGNIPAYSSHGPWETLVIIDLPTSMPVGTGKVIMNTAADSPQTAVSINDVPINFEILDGVGAPNPFNFRISSTTDFAGNLSALEPLPQVVVRPPVQSQGWPTYGAIEVTVKVTMKTSDGVGISDSDVRVVVDDMGLTNLTSQMQTSWVRKGNNITVYFISHKGLMKYYEARFSIVTKPDNVFALPAPSLVSVTYYDVNGNVASGPLPTVTLE